MFKTNRGIEVFFYDWIRFGLINIIFVAIWGTMMRYNMLHELPFFQQQNLLHAHSHFAFGGWISHFIYVGLSYIILKNTNSAKIKIYNRIIIANLISAYGMLIAFSIQGYKAVSITFSTMSIVVAVIFALYYIRDSKFLPNDFAAKPWTLASIFFNAFSIFGPFSLALLMAKKITTPTYNLSSIYYYLHFQYNGWFFFASMAMFIALLSNRIKNLNRDCWILAACTVITYLLSVLILKVKLPLWAYLLTVLAAWAQLIIWFGILIKIIKYWKNYKIKLEKGILILGAIVLVSTSLKFILQALSVFPILNDLAYQYRPFVIAYLHLVLIGIFSLFIYAYSLKQSIISYSFENKFYISLFVIGFLINEFSLVLEGVGWANKINVFYLNEFLLLASLLLLYSGWKIYLLSRAKQ